MRRLILVVMLMAAPLCGQGPQKVTKLVAVKNADPNAIDGIGNMVRLFGVTVVYNSGLKAMALQGTPDQITAAEAAIKQLDVAPKNIDLVVYFVVAGNQAAATPVPASLHDVVAQLKSAFAFQEYGMLDTLTLRTRAMASAETSGMLDASNMPRLTVFSIRSATVGDDGTIRIDRMHAGLRIPVANPQGKLEYTNTGIDQSIDVKEGQKVVVGRAGLAGPEKALFLILTAKVVQ